MAEAVIVYPVEPGDFTSGDINTPLGHHTYTPLRIGCLEGIDVVDEWGFGGDLKITDHTVTLKLKEKVYEIIFFKSTNLRIDISCRLTENILSYFLTIFERFLDES